MKFRQIVLTAVVIILTVSSFAYTWIPNTLKWTTNVYTIASTGFGANWVKSCNGSIKKHTGIDLLLPAETPIYATYWGKVKVKGLSDSSNVNDWGYYITISHEQGPSTDWWTSTYHHISPSVNVGDDI